MFTEKIINIYTDYNESETFEKHMDKMPSNYRHIGVNYAYGEYSYIIEDEESFKRALEYLSNAKIYYRCTDYTPEVTLLENYLKFGKTGFCGKWQCQTNDWGDIELLKDEYVQALIYFSKEKEASLNVSTFQNSYANEAALCQTLVENYGNVIFTEKQREMVNPDTKINLPNGFSVDLNEIDKLYVKLNRGIVSINGYWYKKEECDKTILSFHDDVEVVDVTFSATTDLKFGKDECCIYSGCSERIFDRGDKGFEQSLSIREIKSRLEEILPYVKKAIIIGLDKNKTDVTKELTAPYPEGRYMRKYHLEYNLPDGNVYKGMINISANKEEDLPEIKEISGSFWAERIKAGWLGCFELDCDIPESCGVGESVITQGVYCPEAEIPHCESLDSTKKAEEIYKRYVERRDVKNSKIPRFEGRLEDCIKSAETLFFEDEKAKLMNEQLDKTRPKTIER